MSRFINSPCYDLDKGGHNHSTRQTFYVDGCVNKLINYKNTTIPNVYRITYKIKYRIIYNIRQTTAMNEISQ